MRLPIFVCVALCSSVIAAAVPLPNDSGSTKSLDGQWRFKLARNGAAEYIPLAQKSWNAGVPVKPLPAADDFMTGDYQESSDWHDIKVPGNWEMAGFSPATYNQPDNSVGLYRHECEVPADWAEQRVLINFDGVQNGAEIWINGKPAPVSEPAGRLANYHEGGWTAWQADITTGVEFGKKNVLALRVAKNTPSADLDSGDYFFLGGVHRTVTLFSVPKMHIADWHLATTLLPEGKARVKVWVKVSTEAAKSAAVALALGDDKTTPAQLNEAGETTLTLELDQPRLWSAEHPNLYPLQITLADAKGTPISTVARRVGLRQVTIDQGVLKLNGRPIKLAGMCRHDVQPEMGTAITRELWRQDITLMKAANINCVRTSHYPYGDGFYELCDELGMYVINEVPLCWTKTDIPEQAPAFAQRARETVQRDKNRACVVIWAIGNETPKGENLRVAAQEVRKLDSTRPRLVTWRQASEYGVEIDDLHYTPPAKVAESAASPRRSQWPIMYTENPNMWDVRLGADYGCLAAWGPVLKRTWDVVWDAPGIVGSCMWEWQDRAVADKCPQKIYRVDEATGIQYLKIKGVVDGFRTPRPEYYDIKMVYAPVKVDATTTAAVAGDTVKVDVQNRYSFTALDELACTASLMWHYRVIATVAAQAHGDALTTGSAQAKFSGDDLARATQCRWEFASPDGGVAASYVVPLRAEIADKRDMNAADEKALAELEFPTFRLVTANTHGDKRWWRVCDRTTAVLSQVHTTMTQAAAKAGGMSIAQVKEWSAKVTVSSPKKASGQIHAWVDGNRLKYELTWNGPKVDVQELGWVFDSGAADRNRFSWAREGLWSDYPDDHIARLRGSATPDSADVALTKISRPDAFDFVSTKYNCWRASLTNKEGDGVVLGFPGTDHHVKAQAEPANGGGTGYSLVVNRQCSPPRDLSSNVVPDMYMELKRGSRVTGEILVLGW